MKFMTPTRSLWFLFLIFCLLTLAAIPAGASQDEAADTPPASFVSEAAVSKNDDTGLRFSLATAPAMVDAGGRVTVPGLDNFTNLAGAPRLPYYSTYIAVPPQAAYEVAVSVVHANQVPAAFVLPAPQHDLASSQQVDDHLSDLDPALIYEAAPTFLPDPSVYEKNSFYPAQDYRISEEISADGFRLLKLDVFPIRYNPVSASLLQAAEMAVSITFEGSVVGSGDSGALDKSVWRDRVLNYPPASWRDTTVSRNSADAADVTLPLNVPTYKITVDTDGIYEILGSELANEGMDLAAVDPADIEMMHRGKTVAYEFINNDGAASFGPADAIRFFGWAFDGSRYEDLYVSDNVYWLWVGSSGARVVSESNEAGSSYPVVTTFNESITEWPHSIFFEGWQAQWVDNDPTAWHWSRIDSNNGAQATRNLRIDIPDPDTTSGATADVLVEFTSRYQCLEGDPTTYNVEVALNAHSNFTSGSWQNGKNVNVIHQVAMSEFIPASSTAHPENKINVRLTGSADDNAAVYITRATVNYVRNLIAVGDELLFNQDQAGNHEFHVSGFSSTDQAIVWDISDRYQPVPIDMQSNPNNSSDRNSASANTLLIGRSHASSARFIATTPNNIRNVKTLSSYLPLDLTPPGGAGTWVAVYHASLKNAAETLAAYRAVESGISTYTVDIEDIVNQVGYGFNTPEAVRDFMRDALNTWNEAPQYLTLFGDATVNPRQLDCPLNLCPGWDAGKLTLVPTDLLFVDRYNGLIPVDYTFALPESVTLYPSFAVGRVPAGTLAEANEMVGKIILYETNFDAPAPWLQNMIFVADNGDGGGHFCNESKATQALIPSQFVQTAPLCLQPEDQAANPTEQELVDNTNALRIDLWNQINNVGTVIINYRGHGGETGWAKPSIMHIDDAPTWANNNRPAVVLSADCLDAHFARTDVEGLGETILGLDNNRGSSAHWASTGLGFSHEHTVLHQAFYEALFDGGILQIGDVINYAKREYLDTGYPTVEAYSFTLLGDPAMVAYPLEPTNVGLIRFEAFAKENGARLEWDVETEVGTAGYKIKRGENGAFDYLQDPSGDGDLFILAEGGPSQSYSYVVEDNTAEYGKTYTYQLIELTSGSSEQVQAEFSLTVYIEPTSTPVLVAGGAGNPENSGGQSATATPKPTLLPTVTVAGAAAAASTPQPTRAAPTPLPSATAVTAAANEQAGETAVSPPAASDPQAAYPASDQTAGASETMVLDTAQPAGVVSALEETGSADPAYPAPEPGQIAESAPAQPELVAAEGAGSAGAQIEEVSSQVVEISGRTTSIDQVAAGAVEQDAAQVPAASSSRILLWSAFAASLIIFSAAVIGAILLYSRRKQVE